MNSDKIEIKTKYPTSDEIANLVIYLAGCVIDQKTPVVEALNEEKLDRIYRFASRHMIRAIIAEGLEKAGYADARSTDAIGKAIRRTVLFSNAWSEIAEKLEDAGIDYLPLKGIVLKHYYPCMELREMSDHDILIDPSRADDVKNIMENLGYTTEYFGLSTHDVYTKAPILNFEMHRQLYSRSYGETIYEYYNDVNRFLQGDGCSHTLSDEDFYVYMIVHEYKHYINGGTGLRSLLDLYVFLKQVPLNMDYVNREIERLGLSEFEQQNRSLVQHLFLGEQLSEDDMQMLEYLISSGTYGTVSHRVDNKLKTLGGSKIRYMISRFFVPASPQNSDYDSYSKGYPWFYERKYRLPLLPFYRLFRAFKSGRFFSEFKALKKNNN